VGKERAMKNLGLVVAAALTMALSQVNAYGQ
jgi:hypothetical protein